MNDATLTQTLISAVLLRELDRALDVYPNWKHPFAGLEFSRAKRMFGQAHRDGRIVLSRQFIGTTALADLEDTIRHELAHLIVGIAEKHGQRWKAVAASLGARPRATGKSQGADLQARMSDAPLTLLAVMQSGEEREMKSAFRRSRRYLDYRLGKGGQQYHIKGELIERFVYRERRSG